MTGLIPSRRPAEAGGGSAARRVGRLPRGDGGAVWVNRGVVLGGGKGWCVMEGRPHRGWFMAWTGRPARGYAECAMYTKIR